MQDKVVVFDIYSRSGIDKANIKLASGPFPDQVVLHLHLRGLEELRLQYDKTTVIAAIAGEAGHPVRESVDDAPGKAGDRRAITPDSVYWMQVTIVSDAETPRIPLSGGYIAVELPRDFVARGPYRSFVIQWIDFFR